MSSSPRTSFRSTRPPNPASSKAVDAVQGVLMFDGVTIRDADFRRATFYAFAPEGCAFEQGAFRGQPLDRRFQPLFSSRRRSVFRECRFDEADMRAVRR